MLRNEKVCLWIKGKNRFADARRIRRVGTDGLSLHIDNVKNDPAVLSNLYQNVRFTFVLEELTSTLIVATIEKFRDLVVKFELSCCQILLEDSHVQVIDMSGTFSVEHQHVISTSGHSGI